MASWHCWIGVLTGIAIVLGADQPPPQRKKQESVSCGTDPTSDCVGRAEGCKGELCQRSKEETVRGLGYD